MNRSFTYYELLKGGENYLKYKSVLEYKNDAYILLSEIFNINKAQYFIIQNEKINDKYKIKTYLNAIRLRAKKIPTQYILGYTYFYGHKIYVNKNVLIPRSETELIVEESLKYLKDGNEVLDLCSGSGAIGIALKLENKTLNIDLAEVSKKSIKIIKTNLGNNDIFLNVIKSNLFSKIKKRYHLIVSNPPYIKTSDIKSLSLEVKNNEPKLALDGGRDGIKFYKRIIKDAYKYLYKEGYLLLEIGYDEAEKITKIINKTNQYKNINVIKDYSGLDRIIFMQKK